ncbi:MAG: hypothetical protein FRX49_00727 [Trebouxia sp. A1-2]|nr:MAG: hypothetical protein FRX49_00727 [Trebouxia sp. A1-2]
MASCQKASGANQEIKGVDTKDQQHAESVTHAYILLDWTASCMRRLVTGATAATLPDSLQEQVKDTEDIRSHQRDTLVRLY